MSSLELALGLPLIPDTASLAPVICMSLWYMVYNGMFSDRDRFSSKLLLPELLCDGNLCRMSGEDESSRWTVTVVKLLEQSSSFSLVLCMWSDIFICFFFGWCLLRIFLTLPSLNCFFAFCLGIALHSELMDAFGKLSPAWQLLLFADMCWFSINVTAFILCLSYIESYCLLGLRLSGLLISWLSICSGFTTKSRYANPLGSNLQKQSL